MRLHEITQYNNDNALNEVRRSKSDISKKMIRSLGQHIGEFKKTNQDIDRKLYLLNELIKVLLAASVNQDFIKQKEGNNEQRKPKAKR